MAMPPIPMDQGPLDAEAPGEAESPAEDSSEDYTSELDPQFAAELSKCSLFADASDEDLACVQRAVMGLLGR
jgi:hypothetical protein